jgi:chemotaxis protein methyltransferase CheR
MMLFDTFPQLAQWKVTIQASDLNPQVVAKAKEGVYSSIEVNRGLPVQYLIKYFEQKGAQFVVKEQLRNVIHFFALNLLHHWPQTPVDILFLRNVLIYFDVETKRQMFDKVYTILAPDGYLFLGAAETPYRIHDGFTREAVGTAIVYKKV